MRKRRAGPGTVLFCAIAMTLAAIACMTTRDSISVWGKLLIVVLAVHSWLQFFSIIPKK